RDPFDVPPPAGAAKIQPTPAQSAVLERMRAARAAPDARPILLQGVTGSGKTLVYIEILEDVVRRDGRGAIVLVPEIALTPQTVSRFRARFGEDIAVLHSGLSDGERYDAWRALRDGRRRIAVGARSAIFAPVRDLGAIIVDEEHEASYKQSDSPRYHARDVAVVRARMAGALCVLGSATPALESWHNAMSGKFELLELPDRVAGRALPPVDIVDLRELAERRRGPERDPGGASPGASATATADTILSPRLVSAVHARLQRREQTILLLNRRGYSAFVQCRACGKVWQCAQCNVSLTYHRARRRVVCHHCFHADAVPASCDVCGGTELRFRGVGTEQVERAISDAFPMARVARMDVDTTGGKWAHHRILERVGRGEVDILLGTQMIAKGLDFPNVTLVGVINADVGLNLPDFRATERTFQLLTQVAGRAGRGPRGGEVLIQTSLPRHYALQLAVTHDYRGFAVRELEERAGTGYPPFVRMANIVVSGTEERLVQDAAISAADWARDLALLQRGDDLRVTGPAPCPIDRLRGRWRWHFLLRGRSPHAIGTVCHALLSEYPLKPGRAGLRMAIDRDPVTLL
ncbi:MAG TPA: primosomal protein N', partial [Longimicrobiales bacterium]|nr:primosomal protein N' [Longimicrobiales bacterium]